MNWGALTGFLLGTYVTGWTQSNARKWLPFMPVGDGVLGFGMSIGVTYLGTLAGKQLGDGIQIAGIAGAITSMLSLAGGGRVPASSSIYDHVEFFQRLSRPGPLPGLSYPTSSEPGVMAPHLGDPRTGMGNTMIEEAMFGGLA